MDAELRVGDAERDEVVSALHEHFAQGRLSRDELDERLGAALRARTAGDLRKVTRDLPGPPGPPEVRRAPHWPDSRPGRYGPPWTGFAPQRHWPGPAGYWVLGPRVYRRRAPFGLVFLAALVAAILTGAWAILPALVVASLLLRHAHRSWR